MLRDDQQRKFFCRKYFSSVGAALQYESDDYVEYLLPPDVDKELTDRPFYWLWVEKTNQKVIPTTLRLAFTKNAQLREDQRLQREHEKYLEAHPPANAYERMFARSPKSELIALGCFRFDKILDSSIKRGKFASVAPHGIDPTCELVPWLLICATVSYQSDSMQQTFVSLGICLENNQIVFDFYDKIKRIPMVPTPISKITKRATVPTAKAIDLYRETMEKHVKNQPHDWAYDARLRLKDDLSQLDTYYMSIQRECDDDAVETIKIEHARKRRELIKKGTPSIHVSWTQIAFVGLPLRTSNLT